MTIEPVVIDFASLTRAQLRDDGGKPLEAMLLQTDDIADAVAQAVAGNYAVMPTGGLTSAIGSFEYKSDAVGGFAGVVAIRPKGTVSPHLVDADTAPENLKTDQICIRREAGTIAVGAGLTFTQVNAALADHVGGSARVLVDLTSVGSAYVGGVVATGAMGPLRMRPSSTLEAVVVADGGAPRLLTGAELDSIEGMQGWTGMVVSAVFRFYEVPPAEFGLVLPVQGTDVDAVAGLLAYLEPWTRVNLPGCSGGRLGNGDTVLNGVEMVSRDSLDAFIKHAQDPARSKAQGLLQSCEYANADMLACITGWSEQSVDDVLFSLMDPETETIGGVMIEFGVGFSSGAEMEIFRAIREGAPDMARTKARVTPEGRMKPWSTSTDVNISAPADSGAIAAILTAYADYRALVRAIAEQAGEGLEVELSAYGHLSPHGIDPHHRVSIFADLGRDAQLESLRQAVLDGKRGLIRDLVRAAQNGGAVITGGEKGVPSLVEIARALGGEEHLPDELRQRLSRARQAVGAAPLHFSFRAPAELR
ncbi:FAD-binding oxidoreductase [Magnetospirillum sulfuroxidans]|uniref:FAD-binding oxidoreductase n=1 Tax=Magnetospirillum sulfuroxidans TaxID=611300 RepID=A0ABS5II39_9PROT|nr:FAD-binding oxidoreductase [Magnetospirillum sulfuroxidans]MBR9973872.1 FAD-binding oxidoreductase [Magnetospirillum sulfuroxidans]